MPVSGPHKSHSHYSSKSLSGKQSVQKLVNPVTTKAGGGPIGTPVGSKAGGGPIGTQNIANPVGTKAGGGPIGTPVGSKAGGGPIGTPVTQADSFKSAQAPKWLASGPAKNIGNGSPPANLPAGL